MKLSSIFPPNVQHLFSAMRGNVHQANKMWLYRDLINWLIPTPIQSAVLSTGYRIKGVNISNNKILHNKHVMEKRCFVIGNGPSLKNMDLSILKNEWTIGANSFYKHKDAIESDLNYLCISDASFLEDTENNIKWHKLIEKIMPDTTLIINPIAKKIIDKYHLYQKNNFHYYYRGIQVPCVDSAHFDFSKPLNNGVTVGTLLAIPLAIYMGFREIILIGFDANWLDNFEGSYHFYNEHELYPNFDSPQADDRWSRYEDHLINALRDFISHRLIAEKAQKLDIRIRNATEDGRLDMYPRIYFEECL